MASNTQLPVKVCFFQCFIFKIDIDYCLTVCKLLVLELENRLQDTGKSHDVIETGYTFDTSKRTKKKYTVS